MNNELTYTQIEELKKKLKTGTFNVEFEINKLLVAGYDQEIAKELLLKVIKSHKEDLFYKAKETEETAEKGNIAFGAVMMTSLLVAMLGDNSGFLILLSIAVACLAGYFGFPDKPIPAMIGFTIGAIIMPFACAYYFSGRGTILNIELLIPTAISFGPGFLIKYFLSKMLYSDED